VTDSDRTQAPLIPFTSGWRSSRCTPSGLTSPACSASVHRFLCSSAGLAVGYDQAALEAESATDGWYALLTNLDPAEAGTASVLLRFKGQDASERRYGNYKGPLAVAPMFLQHNRRIAALITVICLALLVFSLAERQVRAQIAPAAKLPGLYADRPARPTGWLIFAAMAGLRLIPAAADRPAVIPRPTPLQKRLLELLDVDPLTPP
jgi:hypothetical protein